MSSFPLARPRWALFLGLCMMLALGSVAFRAPAKASQETAKAEAWISLFNGKDLEGWTPKITGYALGDNYADTFRVENGVLKVA